MASEHFIKWIERRAHELRDKCSLAPFASLNPYDLAVKMGVAIFTPQTIPGLDPDILHQVVVTSGGSWDAATLPLPDGMHVVIMNPTKGKERQHASLMEELSHIHLEHKPAKLRTVSGLVLREWNQTHETQAYWVGAAALVPRRVIKGAITRRMTLADLARQCGVSQDLVIFREKVLGLRLLRAG